MLKIHAEFQLPSKCQTLGIEPDLDLGRILPSYSHVLCIFKFYDHISKHSLSYQFKKIFNMAALFTDANLRKSCTQVPKLMKQPFKMFHTFLQITTV